MSNVYLVGKSKDIGTIDLHSIKIFKNKKDAVNYLTIDLELVSFGDIDGFDMYIKRDDPNKNGTKYNICMVYYMKEATIRISGDDNEPTR